MSNIRAMITSSAAKKQIADALPKHMNVDKQVRVLLTMMNRTPKLEQCTASSVIEALMTCSQMGLEPDGRHAHLIPYGNTCQLIIDYKGLVELAYRSERVQSIDAHVVHENDRFDYRDGKFRDHVPFKYLPGKGGDTTGQGLPIAAYVNVTMKGGIIHQEHMSFSEIEAIRGRSKAGKSGPWVTDWEEMAKKTVFRRASKWLPLSADLQNAILRGDDDVIQVEASDPQPMAALERQSIADSMSDLIESAPEATDE